MTALAELLDAVRAGNTLPWALAHVGADGADAAVRRAWEGETDGALLLNYVRPRLGRNDFASVVSKAFHWAVEVLATHVCPACCDAIRAACACPTWAELTKAGAT